MRNAIIDQANWTFFQNETGLRWYTTFRSLIASRALHRLHAILARPWEPGVVLSAQLPDTREAAAAITRAA